MKLPNVGGLGKYDVKLDRDLRSLKSSIDQVAKQLSRITRKETTAAAAELVKHAAQHLPGGADALTTAIVGDVDLAVSSEGSAASFARSDHHHALDVTIAPTWTGAHTFNGVLKSAVTALANSATPSVAGGNYFTMAGPTSPVTNFTGGVVGQTIWIKAKAAITVNDSGSLNLAGAFNMTSGDVLVLTMFESGTWDEVSRSDNA